MLKHRTPLITALFSLVVASACERLPISIGDGYDLLDPPDGTGSAGSPNGGTGGGSGTGTGTAGVGGGPALGDCEITYQLCLESGEWPEICRAELSRCDIAGGNAGTGSGGAPDGTGAAGAPGYGSGGTGAGGAPDGTGAAGTGAAGAPDGTGVAGAGGTGSGGAAGSPGLDECDSTYVLCLESGEQPEICRGELSRCELTETGGGGGAPGVAGSGNRD
jgi:hypothetical protein